MAALADHIVFKDDALARRYAARSMPMTKLSEAYFDGKLEFRHGLPRFLRARRELVSFDLTWQHLMGWTPPSPKRHRDVPKWRFEKPLRRRERSP